MKLREKLPNLKKSLDMKNIKDMLVILFPCGGVVCKVHLYSLYWVCLVLLAM